MSDSMSDLPAVKQYLTHIAISYQGDTVTWKTQLVVYETSSQEKEIIDYEESE